MSVVIGYNREQIHLQPAWCPLLYLSCLSFKQPKEPLGVQRPLIQWFVGKNTMLVVIYNEQF